VVFLLLTLVLYGGEMLGTVGSFAPGSQVLFFVAFFGITNPPAGLFVMIVLVVPLAAIVADVAARLFARQVPAD